jgi:predicted amidohydrolase
MSFPVAVVQLEVDPAHPGENLTGARARCAEALARGARVVLLPNAFYSDLYRGAEALAESIPGPLTATLSAIAGEGLIAAPVLERGGDGSVYNACALVDRTGVRGVARQTHLYYDPSGADLFRDSDVFRGGDALTIVEFNGVRVGVLLGFDAEFPEAFRALALRGADLVLVALNCIEPDRAFLSAMARRNCIPIAVANRLGFKRIYPADPEFCAAKLPIVQDKRGECMLRCRGGSGVFGVRGEGLGARGEGRGDDEEVGGATAEPSLAPAALRIPADFLQDERVLMASFNVDEIRIERMTSPLLNGRRSEVY